MDILTFSKTNIPRAVMLALISLAIAGGTINTIAELTRYCAARRMTPFSFYGDGFNGLGAILRGEKYLGYYTDKNIDEPRIGAEFSQAQLALAPLIFKLVDIPSSKPVEDALDDKTVPRFVLFDCRNEKECWRKMNEMRARPLKRSTIGTVLAITTPR